MCSNGKSYCKAGYACTGGNECRPVAQARENCTAEARAEAKINIDWELLHDAPARHTFETARSSGKDVFNSLLDAQGHNPEAQASIRRCKDWSISYASSLLAREEQDPDAELQTGIALFDRKDFVAAISHFEIALRAFRAKNNPAAAEVENYLARARAALQGSQYGQGGRMSVGTRQEETGGLPGPIRVILSGGYEVPPVSTLAGGSGTFSVAADGTITGSIVTGGMRGTTAHIHRGAKGQNGPVIIALTKRGDTYSVPDGRRLTPEQVQDLKAGKLYVNVHSDRYKGGELRAQLQP